MLTLLSTVIVKHVSVCFSVDPCEPSIDTCFSEVSEDKVSVYTYEHQ